MSLEFTLKNRYSEKQLPEFADQLISISREIGFRVSARGWCYIIEQSGFINKDEFNKVADLINKCRKKGLLPVDFVAEESAREFSGVEKPCDHSVQEDMLKWLSAAESTGDYYSLDWWDKEQYYIQMVVEKIDLVTLFEPVCEKYKIPIANSKGWSSILQRAEYSRRYKEAEDKGLKCVLLYCGDHDPDGLRIGKTLMKNIEDVSQVFWQDGESGYDPSNLIVDRFGLNYDFIIQNRFSWIDNLITGSGKNLADPRHKNYGMPYLQNYLRDVGERKCEANAIVTKPEIAKELCEKSIEKYLGDDAEERFKSKRDDVVKKFDEWLEDSGVREHFSAIRRAVYD